jgi:hypothetical protein
MFSKNTHVGLDAPHPAAMWVESVTLDPLQVDCVTAQVLAILDNQCELGLEEQLALMAIYSVVKHRRGLIFDQAVHLTIDKAWSENDPQLMQQVRELRHYAEHRLPKQVMRHFKRFLAESLNGFDSCLDSPNNA